MRDMREVSKEQDFLDAKEKFIKKFQNSEECHKETDCDWNTFKKSFLKYSKNKCPICEHTLTKNDDVDHFRPKRAGYEFLRCCCDNYMIMCIACNRNYKLTNFPLHESTKATSRNKLHQEKPLLVNPMTDDILDFFKLCFIQNGESYTLEIYPKNGLDENSYEYKKAIETIKLYGIGFCKDNPKVDSCRINILEEHFEKFIDLARARDIGEKEFLELLKKDSNKKKREYGFIRFIYRKQYEILCKR